MAVAKSDCAQTWFINITFLMNYPSCNLKVYVSAQWGCFCGEYSFHKCMDMGNNRENLPIYMLNGCLCRENCLTSFLPTYCFCSWCCRNRTKPPPGSVLPTLKLCQCVSHPHCRSSAIFSSWWQWEFSCVRVMSVFALDPVGICACWSRAGGRSHQSQLDASA